MKQNLITLLILAGFVATACAVETGAEFLRIDTTARAVSMGSAYTAMADGVNSICYNPAGLSSVKGMELGFTHTNWLLDSMHDFVGVAAPIKSLLGQAGWALGLGVTRLSNSGLETRNADRSAAGGFSAYDQSVSVGLAKAMGRYRGGLAVKYVESSIAGEKATSAAVDLGVTRGLGGRLPVSIGFSAQNLGMPMQYMDQKDPLPLTVAAGMLVTLIPGFNLALDVKRLVYDKQTALSIGSEYSFMPGFALRTGYMAANNTVNLKNRGLSLGAGVNFLSTQLDYSAAPFGELGNTQKLTLTKKF